MIDPVRNRHWKNNQLYSWDKAELGMEHMPNVVIAVLSQTPASKDTDLIDSLSGWASYCRFTVRAMPKLCPRHWLHR